MIIQLRFLCWHKKAGFGDKEWLAASRLPAREKTN